MAGDFKCMSRSFHLWGHEIIDGVLLISGKGGWGKGFFLGKKRSFRWVDRCLVWEGGLGERDQTRREISL